MDSRERFRRALRGEPADRVPFFPLLMFFAADRARLNYREYATNGRALAQAQLQMLERFGVEAVSACSDAFRLSADLGGEMEYSEERTPSLTKPLIMTESDLAGLARPDPTRAGSRMNDRLMAVGEMARAARDRCHVLGWVEMPFAESCNLCGAQNFMVMLFEQPAFAHRILDWVTQIEIEFGLAQLEAGADIIGCGDAAASMLSPKQFAEFAAPYEKRVTEGIRAGGGWVKLHICGNTSRLLEHMAGVGADLYNIDHMVDLAAAKRIFAERGLCLKGNLDPVADLMRSTPERCAARAHECIRAAGPHGYMLSAGCEIPAATPDEVMDAFCRAPQTF